MSHNNLVRSPNHDSLKHHDQPARRGISLPAVPVLQQQGNPEPSTITGNVKDPQPEERRAVKTTPFRPQVPVQKKNDTGLPDDLKAGMENLSGYSMDDVKVHYNSLAPAQLQADAYAQGTDIHIGPGQERHIPHEAWHVVQQKQGRVQPTLQLKSGISVNDDKGLEEEADRMGEKALQRKSLSPFSLFPSRQYTAVQLVQRHILLGKKEVAAAKAQAAIDAFRVFLKQKSVTYINKTDRKHSLYKAIDKDIFVGRQEGILKVIEAWLKDDIVDGRSFTNWDKVILAASSLDIVDTSSKELSAEKAEERKRKFDGLYKGLSKGDKNAMKDSLPGSEEEERMVGLLPELKRHASFTTDMFAEKLDDERTFLPIRRRKKHRTGNNELPGYKVRYRTYMGTISPKANAFILGGSLATDYAPLIDELIKLIAGELKAKDKDLEIKGIDRIIAKLFLDEMSGANSFADFSAEVQGRAHKVIAIILFAEFSRHSIALLSAASAFHAVASRKDDESEPALSASFATGSGKERPLFAGKGGAEIMRSETLAIDKLKPGEIITRRARGVVDLMNFLKENQQKGEELADVVKRKTLEFHFGMVPHTDEHNSRAAGLNAKLYRYLRNFKMAKKIGDNPLVTLESLGFVYHNQPGNANDCAIYSLYHQLTARHGLIIPDVDAFVNHVRAGLGGQMGTMIDLVGQGQAMIAAAIDYIVDQLHLAPVQISINIWAATGDGGLMEFNNVASSGGGSLPCVLYYNGSDHFDSLIGGAMYG